MFSGLRRGFTLIELLVVIAIITLFTAVGVPAFRNYGQKRQLNQAAEQVKSAILEAKSMALAPPANANPNPPTSYIIKGFFAPNDNTCQTPFVWIFQDVYNEDPNNFNYIKQFNLPTNFRIGDGCGELRLDFSVPENGKIIINFCISTNTNGDCIKTPSPSPNNNEITLPIRQVPPSTSSAVIGNYPVIANLKINIKTGLVEIQ